MTNVFEDIDMFATACDQPPSEANYKMYLDLIREETDELEEAIQDNDKVEQLDALVDILVVTMGAIRAAGWDGEGAWKEVMDTNFAKIDPETGKVRKREDGKVLKPADWKAPDLVRYLGNDIEGHPV
jgi:predicted HAD superfamily Cof-like phosphohydrolase